MKRPIAVSLLILFSIPALAFAHAGEVHSYMGTVTSLREDGFMLETSDGATMHVQIASTTTFLHADGQAAKASDLKVGTRVVAKIGKDGRTALTIRMAGKKSPE